MEGTETTEKQIPRHPEAVLTRNDNTEREAGRRASAGL